MRNNNRVWNKSKHTLSLKHKLCAKFKMTHNVKNVKQNKILMEI